MLPLTGKPSPCCFLVSICNKPMKQPITHSLSAAAAAASVSVWRFRLDQVHTRLLPSPTSLVAKHWRSVFSHIARLPEAVAANQALCCHADASLGRPPHHSWKRRPGRPRNNWLEHIRQDSAFHQLIYGIGPSSMDTER